MLKEIRELFLILTPAQKSKYYRLQFLVVLMAFFELIGIGSVGPFMALIGDISLIDRSQFFQNLYVSGGFQNHYDFLFALGILVLLSLFVASMISMVTTWRLSLYAHQTGTEIADRLFNYYLFETWLFHSKNSSASLIKQISTESNRVTTQVILPFMHMNARAVLVMFIAVALLVYNFQITVFGIVFFGITYICLFKVVRSRLARNGEKISSYTQQRFSFMNQAFGGIKEIILLNRQNYFIDEFSKSGQTLARAGGVNAALAYAPRFLMELLSFGVMVVLILVLLKVHQGNLSAILPLLGVYGLAGFKMLPALQNIFTSLAEVKGHLPAFQSLRSHLLATQKQQIHAASDPQVKASIRAGDSLRLENVSFKYPDKEQYALNGLTLEFPIYKTVGIVGSSGAGKSTLIDILLGIIQPDQGVFQVGDVRMTNARLRSWQNLIGYVPQNVFLSEGSIAENIAFGIAPENIDFKQIEKVIKMAHLNEWVNQLPRQHNTPVGERGVQLSGGQRQRIGIARALYSNAEVLVFDEATSALDGLTEKHIMNAITELKGEKTIVLVAHRLKTVRQCDIIFFLENGRVRNHGSYEYLMAHDELFNKMASLA